MKQAKPPRTIDDFLAELQSENKTLSQWAREQKLPLDAIYALLCGRTFGSRGKSREVLLAMKVEPPPMFGRLASRPAATQRA